MLQDVKGERGREGGRGQLGMTSMVTLKTYTQVCRQNKVFSILLKDPLFNSKNIYGQREKTRWQSRRT